jgi:hypothetical protein
MLGRQMKTMKHPDDKHVYHYMFVAGLKPNINAEVMRLPESLKMQDMKFNEVLELAKRAEQTVNSQSDSAKHPDGNRNGDRKVKTKDKSNSRQNSTRGTGRISHEKLTPKEKTFLTNNIQRGGGMVVNEELRKKWEWIKWARKEGVCIKCAGKGHRIAECVAGSSKPSEKDAKLNSMLDRMQDNVDNRGMEPDSDYLCSIDDRANVLMMYHCEVGKVQVW